MLDEVLSDLQDILQDLMAEENPVAAQLFTRPILEKLAALSQSDYQRFKDRLAVELFVSGLKIKDLPSEPKLDRLVEAVRAEMQARSDGKEVYLKAALPDAPGADGLLVPSSWSVGSDGIRSVVDPNAPGPLVADTPLFVSGRLLDVEQAEETLVIQIRTDEWRQVHIPAYAGTEQILKAVSGAGVMVFNKKSLAEYVQAFRWLNRRAIPLRQAHEAFESLFDRWRNYVDEHRDKFAVQHWGRFVTLDGRECLAVVPERLEAFLKKNGARMRPTLAAWRKMGFLVSPKDGYLQVVWHNNAARRMVVFSAEELGLSEPAAAGGARDAPIAQ